ncbi:hypothetical protein [Acinetobacter tianfuensis]|uniref:Uncharacterized protein n=1 Tax=Acinetobacter tianfuensis TaxID=2419603 RepID=A0A3A8EIV7_9GAMM|nr:hypothetical protein D7V32_00065 [Acinetobacter tianfuensis]
MQGQFHSKLAFIAYQKMAKRLIFLLVLMSYTACVSAAENIRKPTWYRYYDSKGVSNISTSVTPNHIRYGYEALDQNMQVIKRNKPYNAEADIKQAPQRAAAAKRNEADAQLKRAYSNSKVAEQKKHDILVAIKKQIVFQQGQLKQLQEDRIMFVRQEREYNRKAEPMPAALKTTLNNNQKNIIAKKEDVQSLQTRYRNTAAEYDRIIARLKAME